MSNIVPYQPYIEVEAFMSNGGKIIKIQNPDPENLIPFFDKLDDQYPLLSQNVYHSDPERFFYIITQWGMDKCINDYYDNSPDTPTFVFAVAEDNTICGFTYFSNQEINSEPHLWIFNWVSLPNYKGAGSATHILSLGYEMRTGIHLSSNVDQRFMNPNLADALEVRKYVVQDPETLWHTISNQDMQKSVFENYEFGQILPNFKKISSFIPTIDENCVFCWNDRTWYPESQAPKDLGSKPVLNDKQVYQMNYDTIDWDPLDKLPWK